jgi:hypothetical protein
MMDGHVLMRPMFPQSRYMPCTECGTSVDRTAAAQHVCDGERMLDLSHFQLREEIVQGLDWFREQTHDPPPEY